MSKLADDAWLLTRLPQLNQLRWYRFSPGWAGAHPCWAVQHGCLHIPTERPPGSAGDARQAARLHCLRHWMDRWYARTGAASLSEAGNRIEAIVAGFQHHLRPARSLVRLMCLILWQRAGLAADLVEWIMRCYVLAGPASGR